MLKKQIPSVLLEVNKDYKGVLPVYPVFLGTDSKAFPEALGLCSLCNSDSLGSKKEKDFRGLILGSAHFQFMLFKKYLPTGHTHSCGFVWLKGRGWLLLYFSVTISSKRL